MSSVSLTGGTLLLRALCFCSANSWVHFHFKHDIGSALSVSQQHWPDSLIWHRFLLHSSHAGNLCCSDMLQSLCHAVCLPFLSLQCRLPLVKVYLTSSSDRDCEHSSTPLWQSALVTSGRLLDFFPFEMTAMWLVVKIPHTPVIWLWVNQVDQVK